MINLIKENWKYFEKQINNNYNKQKAEIIVKKLNEEKLIIIRWANYTNKTWYLNNIISKTNFKNNYLYFNKDIDLLNKIKTEKELFLLIQNYTKNYNKANLIILENINNIDWIKSFISYLYKNNYKIIIISNSIKIPNKPEVEIFENNIKTNKNLLLDNYNYTKIVKYWSIETILKLTNKITIKDFLKAKKEDLIFNSIIKEYWIKNYSLYNSLLIFLSLNNKNFSIREITKKVSEIQKISIKSLLDYINFSIESRVIKRIYNFDFKKNKEINSKWKYYFSDTWIRNSISNFNLDGNILEENLVFLELEKAWYKIYSWTNWKFDFNFFCKKQEIKENKLIINTLFIHISETILEENYENNIDKRKNIKKEINKLLKVPELPKIEKNINSTQTFRKFLLTNNTKKLWLKKLKYENLEIISIEDFLEKI